MNAETRRSGEKKKTEPTAEQLRELRSRGEMQFLQACLVAVL